MMNNRWIIIAVVLVIGYVLGRKVPQIGATVGL